MKQLILMQGIQASGKTTWAKNWTLESPETRIRISNDDIRNMLGKYWVPEREFLVNRLKRIMVSQAMTAGMDIVIDNMNLNPHEIEFWNNIVRQYNDESSNTKYDLIYHPMFNISLEDCIERDSKRTNPIGEKVIKQTFNKYRSYIIGNLLSSEYNKIQETIDGDTIIVDIDATLCFNLSGRPFYGKGCAEGICNDKPIKQIIDMVNTLSTNYNIVIVTGRENTPEIRKATEDWLVQNKVNYDDIYFREVGDYIAGDICKYNLYNKYVKQNYNVALVIEDSTKCVKMYREQLGLIVLQPNKGLF